MHDDHYASPEREMGEKQKLETLLKMAKVKKKINKLSAKNRVIKRK